MAARQPRDTKKTRVHIVVENAWLKTIDRAARQLHLARSHYMAKAAYETAKAMLEKETK